MKILAVDPGFERVGIAVLEGKRQPVLLYSSCFKTSPGKEFGERLLAIGKEMRRVAKEWKPEALAIETLLFNSNQKTAMRVAEARGVMLYEAKAIGLSVHEYTPLQIKIAVTGYGKAAKPQVDSMVRRLIDVKKSRVIDDEMDAIAIGLTALASIPTSYPQD